MAILETQDANILDADAVNWRLVVYPVLGFIVLLVGGLVIYYYQQSQRDQQELAGRQAVLAARTPEDLAQVADRFPHTSQAAFALIAAAELSLNKKDYAAAVADYQRIVDDSHTDAILRDSAEIGLASSLEAESKLDDALKTYLTVAHRGAKSPYAPFAYMSAARLYEQQNDKENERKLLTEAAALGGNSPFVKEADYRLKQLNSSAQIPSAPAPAGAH